LCIDDIRIPGMISQSVVFVGSAEELELTKDSQRWKYVQSALFGIEDEALFCKVFSVYIYISLYHI
jgi:hypothetical protein